MIIDSSFFSDYLSLQSDPLIPIHEAIESICSEKYNFEWNTLYNGQECAFLLLNERCDYSMKKLYFRIEKKNFRFDPIEVTISARNDRVGSTSFGHYFNTELLAKEYALNWLKKRLILEKLGFNRTLSLKALRLLRKFHRDYADQFELVILTKIVLSPREEELWWSGLSTWALLFEDEESRFWIEKSRVFHKINFISEQLMNGVMAKVGIEDDEEKKEKERKRSITALF